MRRAPQFPASGFADFGAARDWAREFVHWYNHDHRHSGIRYVSPAQRHAAKTLRSSRRSMQQALADAGFDEVLAKPYNFREISEMLEHQHH